MKAEELMVGDWIMLQGQPKKIETPWDLLDVKMAERNLQPIPLTSEILEANGFNKTDEYGTVAYRLNIDNGDSSKSFIDVFENREGPRKYHIIAASIYDGYTTDVNINIDNVHEMQHAINISGLIKEINYVQGNN